MEARVQPSPQHAIAPWAKQCSGWAPQTKGAAALLAMLMQWCNLEERNDNGLIEHQNVPISLLNWIFIEKKTLMHPTVVVNNINIFNVLKRLTLLTTSLE